jgi:predicted TIM-barrel fold metal-dependent hydrolase
VTLFGEPKIDAHCHVLDPARFPYPDDIAYRPAGQEIGTPQQYLQVMEAYGIRHALIVGPNSGYGLDNRCLLDTLRVGGDRFRGVAVVRNDASREELQALKQEGVIGVAFNATVLGVDHYLQSGELLRKLADLDLFVSVQVEHDQLVALKPLLESSGVRLLVDHCGRPRAGAGVEQPGFPELLSLARTGRVAVKLSGYQKFSTEGPPYRDAAPFVRALLDAYTPDACLWASDWPFLRSPVHLDVGPLLVQFERLVPDAADRQRILWDTPRRWFGFSTGRRAPQLRIDPPHQLQQHRRQFPLHPRQRLRRRHAHVHDEGLPGRPQRRGQREHLRLPRRRAVARQLDLPRRGFDLLHDGRAAAPLEHGEQGLALRLGCHREPGAAQRGQLDRHPLPGNHAAQGHPAVVADRLQVDHLVAVRRRQPDVDVVPLGSLAHQRRGNLQLRAAGAHRMGQAQHGRCQAPGTAARVLLQQPAADQRLRETGDRGPRQAGALREFGIAQRFGAGTEGAQHVGTTFERSVAG